MAWAWEQDVPASEKLLLVALADECRGDGVVLHLAQADLAAKVGAGERTVRGNLAKLAERGMVLRAPQFEGRQRIADRIALAMKDEEPADVAAPGEDGRALLRPEEASKGGEEASARQDSPRPAGDVLDAIEAPDGLRADARELLRTKRKVDGRLVTVSEMARTLAAVAEFNRQSGSDFGLGAHLRAVVMRIRERPSYDAEAHVRLVQSAWRLKWWEQDRRSGYKGQRRPTPAVIYGNERVFEQVVQDAVDEKNGRPADGPPARKRFTRED